MKRTTRSGWGGVAVGLLAALLVGASGCRKAAPPDPDIVATVGNRTIRTAEFQEWMRFHAVGDGPGRKEAALEELIGQAALVERARAVGLDKDPELLRSWESMLVVKLRERELDVRLTNAVPAESEVRAYYDGHPSEFAERGRRQGSVLFLEVPAKTSPERKATIRERLVEARTRALALPKEAAIRGFGALAIDFSEDQPTRYRGGDFGWIEEGKKDGRFDPVVTSTLFGLEQVGDISEVLEGKNGFYLVRLTDLRPGRQKPFESVAATIRHRMQFEGRKQLETAWKKEARDAVRVEIRPEVVARIPAPQRTGPRDDAPPSVR